MEKRNQQTQNLCKLFYDGVIQHHLGHIFIKKYETSETKVDLIVL